MNHTERELNMKQINEIKTFYLLIGILVMAAISGIVGAQTKQSQPAAGLPSDLFVSLQITRWM
jgi:hypothetical protein